jgi:hypothetical protein
MDCSYLTGRTDSHAFLAGALLSLTTSAVPLSIVPTRRISMKLPYLKRSFLSAEECEALIKIIERYTTGDGGLRAAVRTERRTQVNARFLHDDGLLREAELVK